MDAATECSNLKQQIRAAFNCEVKVRHGKGCKRGAVEVFLPKSVRLVPEVLAQAESLIRSTTGRCNMLGAPNGTPMVWVYTIQPLFE